MKNNTPIIAKNWVTAHARKTSFHSTAFELCDI